MSNRNGTQEQIPVTCKEIFVLMLIGEGVSDSDRDTSDGHFAIVNVNLPTKTMTIHEARQDDNHIFVSDFLERMLKEMGLIDLDDKLIVVNRLNKKNKMARMVWKVREKVIGQGAQGKEDCAPTTLLEMASILHKAMDQLVFYENDEEKEEVTKNLGIRKASLAVLASNLVRQWENISRLEGIRKEHLEVVVAAGGPVNGNKQNTEDDNEEPGRRSTRNKNGNGGGLQTRNKNAKRGLSIGMTLPLKSLSLTHRQRWSKHHIGQIKGLSKEHIEILLESHEFYLARRSATSEVISLEEDSDNDNQVKVKTEPDGDYSRSKMPREHNWWDVVTNLMANREDDIDKVTTDNMTMIKRCRKKVPKDEMVMKIGPFPISMKALEKMQTTEWLDDNIVNGIMHQMQHDILSKMNNRRIMVHPSTCMFQVTNSFKKGFGYEMQQITTASAKAREHQEANRHLLLCCNNSHWWVMCVDLEEKKIFSVDSMNHSHATEAVHLLSFFKMAQLTPPKRIRKKRKLEKKFSQEWYDTIPSMSGYEYVKLMVPEECEQLDSVHCGLYAIAFSCQIIENWEQLLLTRDIRFNPLTMGTGDGRRIRLKLLHLLLNEIVVQLDE